MPNLIALTVVSQSIYRFDIEIDFSAVLKIGFLKEQQDQILQELEKVRAPAQLHHIMDPDIERAQVELHYCQQFCRVINDQESPEWAILNTRTRLFPWHAESRITYFYGRPVATLVRGRFEF